MNETASGRTLRTFLLAMVAADLLLLVAYLAAAALMPENVIFELVNLDLEGNIPAWYAASKHLVVGLVFLVLGSKLLAACERVRGLRPLFLTAGAAFVFVSADEAAAIHEKVTMVLNDYSWVPTVDGQGVWLFLYGALALAAAILLSRQILRFCSDCRREALLFVAGAAIMLSGEILVEVVGYLADLSGTLATIQVATEETLALLGQSVMVYAVCSLLMDSLPGSACREGELDAAA